MKTPLVRHGFYYGLAAQRYTLDSSSRLPIVPTANMATGNTGGSNGDTDDGEFGQALMQIDLGANATEQATAIDDARVIPTSDATVTATAAAATATAAAATATTTAAAPAVTVHTTDTHTANRLSQADWLSAQLGIAHPVHTHPAPADIPMLLEDRRMLSDPSTLSRHAISNGLMMMRREAAAFSERIINEEAARVTLRDEGRPDLQAQLWTRVHGGPVANLPPLGLALGEFDLPGPLPGMGNIARAPEPPVDPAAIRREQKKKSKRKAREDFAKAAAERERERVRKQKKRADGT